ncbi:MAG: hypothetical protein Q8R96_13415 [Bacteroidota bacterium]|nr:hypothetical protein [Bacteroidota bacterium]
MGKAENIKRAKKIKEAKKRRELATSGIINVKNSYEKIMKRSEMNGIEIRLNQGKFKYSDIIEQFLQPMISDDDDLAMLKSKYSLGAIIWNSVVFRHKDELEFQNARKKVCSLTPDIERFEKIFDEMVKRKEKYFGKYKFMLADFEITPQGQSDFHLTVAVTEID